MTQDIKTAIKEAEKTLETERAEKLQTDIYGFLKQELEEIDGIENKIRKLSEEKRAHEENIKNVKQGNLEAIEKRRQAFNWNGSVTVTNWPHYMTGTYSSPATFYANNVAGFTYTTGTGKTYIF